MRSPKFLLLLLLCLAGPLAARNRVLELDGDSSYVQLPGGIFDSLEDATVEAWVKWEDQAYFSQWFAFGTDDVWKAMGINHFENSSIFQFFIYAGQHDLHVLRLAVDLPLGQWCHMAAVSGRDGMRFYLDGVLVGWNSFAGSFAAIAPNEHNYLGRSNWKENAFFRGQLDEVRVWSTARSAEQIRAGMEQRFRSDEEGLVGLWNFDAGDARDLSPQGHAGRLMGQAHCIVAPFPGTAAISHPAVVEGFIRDETGVPLIWAATRLKEGDAQVVGMETSADGHYALAVFDTGTYALEAGLENAVLPWADPQQPGMENTGIQTQEVFLQEGEVLNLDLIAPSSQVARWSGNGDARDAVEQNHGTLQGSATCAPGRVGQAFHLDGVDDHIRVPHAADLNPTGSFTLIAWIYPTTEDRRQVIFHKAPDPGQPPGITDYNLLVDPGLALNFMISDDAHQGDLAFLDFRSPANVLTCNIWNQVAAVYDQTTGIRRIYVNGIEVAQRQDTPINLTRNNGYLYIGGTPVNERLSFKGLIDEVSIYRRALADGTIQRLYSASAEARWPGEGHADDTWGSNHGIVAQDATFAPGVVGQAFSFDGQGSHVQFNPLIGNYGTADFTLELWFRRAGERSALEPLLSKYFDAPYLAEAGRYFSYSLQAGNETDSALDLSLDADGRVQVKLAGTYDTNRFGSTRPLPSRTWHHLAMVRQGKEARLYVDGRLDTLQATPRVIDLTVPAPLTLGGSPVRGRYFHGLLDEVAFHNRALPADEIRTVYQNIIGARRRRILSVWLGRGGIGLVILVALFSSSRYYTQRKTRRLREAQLAEERRARKVADAANQAKSAFLAHMSHEIRTPMNAILGYAQILRNHPALAPELYRAVEAIHTSGDHLLDLINDVLDLSKIESGRMELQPVDFDLARLVEGLAVMFQLRCQQKRLDWKVERDGESWQVRGDESKLRQVLVNLLGNAIKFTDAGEVTLRLETQQKERYYFEVRDTGPGISPEQLEEIFEPFQQGRLGMDAGGTGLGLAIARRHVELMGGELRLESIPDQGARFFFTLTLTPARGPVADETEKRYGQVVRLAPGHAPRVLIIDDVETNLEILAQILERIGAQVLQAGSGEQALALLRCERSDLVFTDIRMPAMDGMELLRRIRQEYADLPVVGISASVMGRDKQYYLRRGFDAFIDKPFRLEHIYACLEELLGVQYEYAQPVEAASSNPVDFAGLRLPAPLRTQLRLAAEMHNVTGVKLCLAQLRKMGEQETQLASHLNDLAQRFDLGSVLEIVEKTVDG